MSHNQATAIFGVLVAIWTMVLIATFRLSDILDELRKIRAQGNRR